MEDGKKTRKVGRPRHEPSEETRAYVKRASGLGIRQELIADKIGISESTLRAYYLPEINAGKREAHELVAESILARAIKSDKLAIFYAKTQMRWKEEPQEVELNVMQGLSVNVIPKAEEDDPED